MVVPVGFRRWIAIRNAETASSEVMRSLIEYPTIRFDQTSFTAQR